MKNSISLSGEKTEGRNREIWASAIIIWKRLLAWMRRGHNGSKIGIIYSTTIWSVSSSCEIWHNCVEITLNIYLVGRDCGANTYSFKSRKLVMSSSDENRWITTIKELIHIMKLLSYIYSCRYQPEAQRE